MEELRTYYGIIDGMETTLLGVHPKRCMMVRNRNADCFRCANVCTTGAISLQGDELVVDVDKCMGCGTCATACPTCALEAKNPTDAQLSTHCAQLLAASGDGTLKLHCSSCVGAAGTPDVMCMGRLDESLLVEMSLRGCTRLVLHVGDCEQCPHHNGGALATQIVESARGILAAYGRDLRFERILTEGFVPERAVSASLLAEKLPVQHEDGPEAESEPAEVPAPLAPHDFEHVDAQTGVLSHHSPTRRIRLFKLMGMLGEPVTDQVTSRLWGEVTIDKDTCMSCRMCAVFCPTGALTRVASADGEHIGLEHRPALCMQCRMCQHICARQAITVSDQVSLHAFTSGYHQTIQLDPVNWKPNTYESVVSKTRTWMKGTQFLHGF